MRPERNEREESGTIPTIPWRRAVGLLSVLLLLVGSAGPAARTFAARQTASPADSPPCPTATPAAPPTSTGVTVGYAGPSGDFPFVQAVNAGIERAATCLGVTLVVADNRFDLDQARRVAEDFVARGVAVAVEYQTDAGAAADVCAPFAAAGIPVVAIDVPHPCAIYVGADNRRAGRIAGFRLARAATERWGGEVDALVLIEMPESSLLPLAGPLLAERAEGIVDGARDGLPDLATDDIVRIDGKGTPEDSLTAMANALTRLGDANHILVAAVNDPSAVGALRAAEQAGRLDQVLIAGQGGTIEARDELCAGSPAFLGSVAYFPDRYGDLVLPLALDLARGVPPPERVYTNHRWLDRENLEELYPGECVPATASP